ncbi:MAG: glycoside hydrolase family 99-like domain-containing protein [Pirellulales bacterium]|nr:glycoside hydrolase family 99-like domain-containing protein [Pirellulales bacterium]
MRATLWIRGLVAAAMVGLAGTARAEGKAVQGAAENGKPLVTVGAYYFDGWAGASQRRGDPDEPWADTAPTHLTRRMLEEFPQRKPLWGWRDDSLKIMERQIDLAADHGIAFFAFCWYFHPTKAEIEQDPKHTGLKLFLQARNRHRMRFCLLVANHQGFLLDGAQDWQQAAEHWMPYFTHKQHMAVGGRPLVIIFNPQNGSQQGFELLQAAARKAGLPGLTIAACGGGDPAAGYTHTTHYNIVPGYAGGSQARKYAELVEAHTRAWRGSRRQPCIPEVTAGWDKRPWEGPAGLGQPPGSYYPDRSPEQFAGFLRAAVDWMDRHPEQTTDERVVLIYAWNEYGEGGYLAPTRGDPDGQYLKAIRSVVAP